MTTCTQPMFLQLQLLSVLVPLPRIQGEFIKVHLHRALMCPVVPRLHQRLHFASYLNMQFSHFISPPFLHLTLIPFHVSPVHTMNLCLRPVLQAVYVCTASIALNTQILDWTLSRNAGLCLTQSFFFFFGCIPPQTERGHFVSICQLQEKNSFQCALPPGSNIHL